LKCNIKIDIVIASGLSIFCLLTFWIYSQVFGEKIIFWLGLPFSILAFCLFFFLANPIICRISSIKYSLVNLLALTSFVVSMLLVVLVPTYQGSAFNWVNIPLQNWARGFASLLLTSFFPGFLFLKVVDKKRTIKGGMLIVMANLLSMLFIFLIAFPALLLGYDAAFFSFIVVMILNLFLAVTYCLMYNKQENASRINLSIKGYESIVILSFFVVIVGTLAVMLYNMPLTRSDMWTIYSQALVFSKGFPQYIPNYPYLFQIYLAVYFSISGFPSSISMQLLYLLSFLPLLGFILWRSSGSTKKEVKKLPL